MEFVFCRSKFGTTIYCHESEDEFVFSHDGKEIFRTSDNCRDPVTADANFFAAWQEVTGNCPFSVIRKYGRKYRRVGESFALAGKIVSHAGIKFGRNGRIHVKQS